MKKFKFRRYLIFLIGCTISYCLFFSNTSAFAGNSHKGITKTALETISKINLETDNLNNQVSFSSFYEPKYWNLLIEYSKKPDEDENQGAYKYHFYNAVTERNYMGEKESALTRFSDHFNKAVKYYSEKKIELAFKSLGRAIHFMEDLSTPVHTVYESPSDSVTKFPLHVKFEKKCDQIQGEVIAKTTPVSLVYYEANLPETIGKSSAILSADNFYYLTKDNINENDLKVAQNAVLNAQEKIIGVLYKFYKQVTSENTAIFNNNKLSTCTESISNGITSHKIERGRTFGDNYRCEETFECFPESMVETNSGTIYKRTILATKKFQKHKKDKNKKDYIKTKAEYSAQITFTYDKEKFVKIENTETDIKSRKINSNWEVVDLTEIKPLKKICLVSNKFMIYKGSTVGNRVYLNDSHMDIFCCVSGKIGINTDIH